MADALAAPFLHQILSIQQLKIWWNAMIKYLYAQITETHN